MSSIHKSLPATGARLTAATGLAALLLALLTGCITPTPQAPYPHESLLTVVAELKIYLDQDPYRQAPGQDLGERNIFRVSLERLEALRQLAGPEYGDVLAFARAQCLERLGEWPEARTAFEAAASRQTSLAPVARARAEQAARMAELTNRKAFTNNLEGYMNDLDVLERRLLEWQGQKPPWPYDAYLRQALEQAQAERARLLFSNRLVLEDSAGRAIQGATRLTQEHKDSWRACEHWLLLGSFYEALARDWTAQHPPEGAHFKAGEGWQGFVEQARGAYRHVAQTDGDPTKLEGQARLRALDAYALRVQFQAR